MLDADLSDLFHLVSLRLRAVGLNVQRGLPTLEGEDMVAALDTLFEAQSQQEVPQVDESDISVRSASSVKTRVTVPERESK